VTVALLGVTGVVDLSRFGIGGPSYKGLVAIPISAAPIPAYTRLTRDHLWNPKTNSLSMIYLRPEQVTPSMIPEVATVLGRVLDHDKPAGYTFTEDDFFPKGTRAGLVAGIPAGKRAMRVDAEKVNGMFGLQPGDRFDLVATLPIDANNSPLKGTGIYAQQLDLQARLLNWQKQATVKVLVQNGVIVQPMTTRQVPVFTRTLTQGPISRTRPVQEIVIAVDPNEVVHLTEAISVEAQIACLPRSGRPDDPPNSRTPELRPWSPFIGVGGGLDIATGGPSSAPLPGGTSAFTNVESISGSKREMVSVPRRTN
jgi:Flp pilus assembly protein CpaB